MRTAEGEKIERDIKGKIELVRSYADQVFYRNTQFNGQVFGIDENYLSVYGYQVKNGRGFTQADYDDFRKVRIFEGSGRRTGIR